LQVEFTPLSTVQKSEKISSKAAKIDSSSPLNGKNARLIEKPAKAILVTHTEHIPAVGAKIDPKSDPALLKPRPLRRRL